jgi:hypothetical protein
MVGNWDSMSIREQVDELNQSKANHAQLQQLAQGVDRMSVEMMACLAVLGAMAERSAPDPSRVRAWCAALRNAAPRITQFELEDRAKRIFQLLEPVMNKPPA